MPKQSLESQELRQNLIPEIPEDLSGIPEKTSGIPEGFRDPNS